MATPASAPDDDGRPDQPRRRYDSPVRRQRAQETRDRILAAGSELVHGFASWDWDGLTFRAVAERAGVGERTVYRYFPTERHLHDAVMQRLEEEAGITYEDVDLDNLTEVTRRIFATLHRFAVSTWVNEPDDPTFAVVDDRRRRALAEAVEAAAPDWSSTDRETVTALLDVLWNPPSYERLVTTWKLPGDQATDAITWLIDLVIAAIHDDRPPSPRTPTKPAASKRPSKRPPTRTESRRTR
jgi:AcrR family transcriptional regulator